MSSPKEAELQSPLPGNDANLLSLQETLLGCKSEMPGNLIFLETIFSIIGVGLDQDEYLNLWIVFSRQSNYIHATQGLQELLSDRFV
jgi:hypothetical protein